MLIADPKPWEWKELGNIYIYIYIWMHIHSTFISILFWYLFIHIENHKFIAKSPIQIQHYSFVHFHIFNSLLWQWETLLLFSSNAYFFFLLVLLYLANWASQVAPWQRTHLPMQELKETWVWSLGGEDPPAKEMATHSSILAWRIQWTEEPGGLQSMGLQRVGHDWAGTHI